MFLAQGYNETEKQLPHSRNFSGTGFSSRGFHKSSGISPGGSGLFPLPFRRTIQMVYPVHSLGLHGITGYPVSVECDLSSGLPAFTVVGLPDAALNDAPLR